MNRCTQVLDRPSQEVNERARARHSTRTDRQVESTGRQWHFFYIVCLLAMAHHADQSAQAFSALLLATLWQSRLRPLTGYTTRPVPSRKTLFRATSQPDSFLLRDLQASDHFTIKFTLFTYLALFIQLFVFKYILAKMCIRLFDIYSS